MVLYINFTTYHQNPRVALRAIQAAIVDRSYSVDSLVEERIAETREAIDGARERDESGCTQRYGEELESLELMATRALPTTPLAKIEFVQDAYRYSEIGFGDILEIRDIGEEPLPFFACPADDNLIAGVIGHTQPSQADARKAAFAFKPNLCKGGCLYFPCTPMRAFSQPNSALLENRLTEGRTNGCTTNGGGWLRRCGSLSAAVA